MLLDYVQQPYQDDCDVRLCYLHYPSQHTAGGDMVDDDKMDDADSDGDDIYNNNHKDSHNANDMDSSNNCTTNCNDMVYSNSRKDRSIYNTNHK